MQFYLQQHLRVKLHSEWGVGSLPGCAAFEAAASKFPCFLLQLQGGARHRDPYWVRVAISAIKETERSNKRDRVDGRASCLVR